MLESSEAFISEFLDRHGIRSAAAWTPPVKRAAGAKRAEPRVAVAGLDYATIPVRDLRRAVDFYGRVFGFEIVEARDAHVLIGAGGRAYLALHALGDSGGAKPVRWSFVVDDLERARESLWELGVRVVDGGFEPKRLYAWRSARSLLIRDPDAHEIELVERAGR